MTHLESDRSEDVEAVREFFDQWGIYQKVVRHNYLHHREAYAVLAEVLNRFDRPFRFLDLGAGDAAWTAQVLAGRPVSRYEAVDLSPVALDLARRNLADLPCERVFTAGDFGEVLGEDENQHDLIFIGLSLHHLPRSAKETFLPILRRHLADGGSLLFYEPIMTPGESRDQVLVRWWSVVVEEWTALAIKERAAVRDHVFGADYPESCEDYACMADAAGFAETRVHYRDEHGLYAVIECRG